MDPVVAVTLRVALALLFASAATHKLRDLAAFRATLADYRILPDATVPLAAVAVAVMEPTIAAMLLAWPAAGAPAAAALLLLYAGAIALNLARGRRHIDCGCAGPAARRPIGAGLVARNVVLAAAALVTLAPAASRTLVWVDVATIVVATVTVALLYGAADRLLALAPRAAALRGSA